jgi:hypothetical protein
MADEPKIDFIRIDFPSDKITIKDLRKLHPDQVDADESPTLFDPPLSDGSPRTIADDTIGQMLYTERLIAKEVFNEALGRQSQELFSREEYTAELAASYARYGVATGPHHAEQLVRGIETQASAQARAHTGRRP